MSSIGVLAVQGAFAEHARRLRGLGCDVVELRQEGDLHEDLVGVVLPGGESTTQAKLLAELGMREPLRGMVASGVPVLGTCAGLILLAQKVTGSAHGHGPALLEGLQTMPVTVQRNGYGRQLASFKTYADLATQGQSARIPLTFIRAPRIVEASSEVETLVSFEGEPVAVRYGNQIGCCFHPELDDDDGIYRMFLDLVRSA